MRLHVKELCLATLYSRQVQGVVDGKMISCSLLGWEAISSMEKHYLLLNLDRGPQISTLMELS
jgi:hypothetical protein